MARQFKTPHGTCSVGDCRRLTTHACPHCHCRACTAHRDLVSGMCDECKAEQDAHVKIDAQRCTHPDRGGTAPVVCPKCNTPIAVPADPVDHYTDRTCPVCNADLPYIPLTSMK